MNKTANYQLNQWDAEDKVLRTDFNADNAKIDAALKAEADARTVAVSTLSETVASQGNTLNSHTASLAKLGNCAAYITTYRGNGGSSRSLSFPGYPVAVFIQEVNSPVNEMHFIRGAGFVAGIMGAVNVALTWSDRGVTWTYSRAETVKMNDSAWQYTVVALLDMSR